MLAHDEPAVTTEGITSPRTRKAQARYARAVGLGWPPEKVEQLRREFIRTRALEAIAAGRAELEALGDAVPGD